MKVPKINKINVPKMQINNRFLKRNLFSLIVLAVLVIGTGTAYGTLSTRDADRGSDPVNGVNQDRYQVLVSGEGYKLSKNQEKNYKLQKKQNKVNAAKTAKNPYTLTMPNGNRTFRPGSFGNYNYNYKFKLKNSKFKMSKAPRIMSNIVDQIKMEDKWKAGDTVKFKLVAYAYPYGNKNKISSKHIQVKINGKDAKLYKSDNQYYYYSVELDSGKNKITIKATDKKGKKASKAGPYIIITDIKNTGSSKAASKSESSNKDNNSGKSDSSAKPGKKDDGSSTKPSGSKPSNTKAQKKKVAFEESEDVTLNGMSYEVETNKTAADVLIAAGIVVDGEIITVPEEFYSETLKDRIKGEAENAANGAADNAAKDAAESAVESELDRLYEEYINNPPEGEELESKEAWKAENRQSVHDDLYDEAYNEAYDNAYDSAYDEAYSSISGSIVWTCKPALSTKVKDISFITLTGTF